MLHRDSQLDGFFLERPRQKKMDQDVDGRIILEWILGNTVGRCGLNPTQDRDLWWALVYTIINLRRIP